MPMSNTNTLGTICPNCELRDRHKIAQEYYINFLNRTDAMFKWEGLPPSIPAYILERYLKVNGWAGIALAPLEATEYKDQLVCFFGGLGLKPDLYYQPTAIILSNPVLGSKTYKIGKDVVWAKNDSCHQGISPIISRYAHMLADNDISINIAQINSRIPFVFTAETDNEVESAKRYMEEIEKGKLAVIKTSIFNKGVEPKPTSVDGSGNHIKALIELHQYLKAQFYNDIGIGSNFNMKRERQNVAEVEANSPVLLPLVDEMLIFRKKICEEVNAMFGQNWSVELDSAWVLETLKQELEVKELEANISDPTRNGGEGEGEGGENE